MGFRLKCCAVAILCQLVLLLADPCSRKRRWFLVAVRSGLLLGSRHDTCRPLVWGWRKAQRASPRCEVPAPCPSSLGGRPAAQLPPACREGTAPGTAAHRGRLMRTREPVCCYRGQSVPPVRPAAEGRPARTWTSVGVPQPASISDTAAPTRRARPRGNRSQDGAGAQGVVTSRWNARAIAVRAAPPSHGDPGVACDHSARPYPARHVTLDRCDVRFRCNAFSSRHWWSKRDRVEAIAGADGELNNGPTGLGRNIIGGLCTRLTPSARLVDRDRQISMCMRHDPGAMCAAMRLGGICSLGGWSAPLLLPTRDGLGFRYPLGGLSETDRAQLMGWECNVSNYPTVASLSSTEPPHATPRKPHGLGSSAERPLFNHGCWAVSVRTGIRRCRHTPGPRGASHLRGCERKYFGPPGLQRSRGANGACCAPARVVRGTIPAR